MHLSDLHIKNLTVIQELSLQFEPGLIALTGETGAGKSILLNALDMVLGARGKTDMIRTGSDRAQITAQFALSGSEIDPINAVLDDQGLPPCENGLLLIRRQLNENGRHRQWINDGLTTTAAIRTLMAPHLDMTGQHAQQRLLKPKFQRETLDAYARLQERTEEVAALFADVLATQQEIQACGLDEQEKLGRQDWLQYQIDEIERIAPQVGEDDNLATQRKRLANAAKLQSQGHEAAQLIADGDANALKMLHHAMPLLDQLAQMDTSLAPLRNQVNEAALLLEEASRDLANLNLEASSEPETLAQLDDRLDSLYRLQRKHGKDLQGVLTLLEEMKAELGRLLDLDAHLANCEARLHVQFQSLREAAAQLTAARKKHASDFANQVCRELADLGMPHALFEVCFEPLGAHQARTLTRDGLTLGAHGAENIAFIFAANPGQKPGPLQHVASGGELSRTLLALKRTLQMADPVPMTVFDEVDAGVGGGIGEVIGRKLAALGQFRQVFCVTHLGQIAAQADQHFCVQKTVEGNQTLTSVASLSAEERVQEIARMIGGEALTDVTLAHASEMVRSGAQRPSAG